MSTDGCIEQCEKCQAECAEASAHAITLGADAALIATLLDCAKVAQATAGLLRRLPDLQDMTGRVCADVCETCVEACAAYPDDEVLVACAHVAASCAEACRSLADEPQNTEELSAEQETESETSSFGFADAEPVELAPAEPHG